MRLGSLTVVTVDKKSTPQHQQYLTATSHTMSAKPAGELLLALRTRAITEYTRSSGGGNPFHDALASPSKLEKKPLTSTEAGHTAAPSFPERGDSESCWRSSQRRIVFKSGECNVSRANIKKRRQRYMADIFTTLIDIKWRWNLLNFLLAFILSWLFFALAWWLIAFSHGDLNAFRRSDLKPCVEGVHDFPSALLFSIETQQTIGFGSRHTNPHCPEAILAMMCQSCFGVIIQALMTGLVFAKLSRPKKRAETLLFSKNAVICRRDGQLCLLFRVGDMRKSQIVEAHVRAIMIKKRVTSEGEVVPLYQYDLQLEDGDWDSRLFMVWPVIVEHRITKESPLWEMSAEDLHKAHFELVVVLEGIVESTGMTTQARTSYLPDEILWGHRFEHLVTFQKESGQYLIDYSRFHWTAPIDMPRCSAKDMEEYGWESASTSNEDDDEDAISVRSTPAISAGHRTLGGEFPEDRERRRRLSTISNIIRANALSGVALAAFDIQTEEPTFKSILSCSNVVAEDTFQFL